MKDRQKEFVSKDYIICQEDCSFSEYDNIACFAKCSCKVKEAHQSLADMVINKEKLLSNFKNIKNIVNFKFLVCYNKLFNKEGLVNNIGNYLIFVIILFHIISIFICAFKQFPLIKREINNIISRIYEIQSIRENIKKPKTIKKKNSERNKPLIRKKNIKKNVRKKILIVYNKPINESKLKLNSKNKNKEKDEILKQNKPENIKNYMEEEINGLSYNQAIQIDKRTYCQFYGSLLKTQHNLISALFNNDDYNLGIIKIDLFFIGFTIEYTINALFYNDDTMHKIHENKGQFDLETQIPIIIYSILISYILNLPLNLLALSNDAIINFKQDNNNNDTFINKSKSAKNLIDILAIKFTLFYIISFLFLLFFWYYVSMFGAIYRNTQYHLLKDTLISFGLSLCYPFVIYLFPGCFRIPALSDKKGNKKYSYNFSKFLQII